MDKNKITDIISMVHKQSVSDQLKWEAIGNHEFQVNFPKSSISIGVHSDSETKEEYFGLRFFNSQGILVFEIHAGNVAKYGGRTYKVLEEIYSAAQLSNLQVQDTFDDILSALEGLDNPFEDIT
ncbi:hypothetical protein ACFL0O_10740 [Thermodesulfobacteriota bacterium]